MKYTKLGTSDLTVSRICLGCMGFGDAQTGQHSWTLDEPHSDEIIRRSIDLGINFFDTAIGYQSGTSEQFLGRSLKKQISRDKVVVATKFLPRAPEDAIQNINGKQHIERMINRSLHNLGMDYVDLFIYHMWDYHTPLEEIMEGLNEVVKAGKARYIGISNCFAWQLAKANAYAENNGLAKFISMQGHYNLIYREEEREMIPYCQEGNIALTPYSALASGRLAKSAGESSKRLTEDQYAKLKYDHTKMQDEVIIARVAAVAQQRGISMSDVSLAWLLSKVASPIVGATKLHHIENAVRSVDIALTEDEVNYLEEAYMPHNLSGVLAQNRKNMTVKPVWNIGEQKL